MESIDSSSDAEISRRIEDEKEELRVLKSNLIQADSDRSHRRKQREELKVNAEL